MYPYDRVPVIPLSYKLRDLAVEHEFIIDYDTGRPYIIVKKGDPTAVNPDGTTGSGDTVYDITDTIVDLILKKELETDRLAVNIDGLGLIKLSDFLNLIYKGIFIPSFDADYKIAIPRQQRFDMATITVKDGKVQLKGFDTAEIDMIPYKSNEGVVKWKPESGGSGGSSGTAHGKTIEVKPNIELGTLTLISNAAQYTSRLAVAVDIVMPKINTDYCKIVWKLSTGANPVVKFPTTLIWQYQGSEKVEADSTHIFEFESWDKGISWLATNTKFGSTLSNDSVTIEYLVNNLYYKKDIDDMMSWNNKRTGFNTDPV